MRAFFSPITVGFVRALSTMVLAQTSSAPQVVVPSFPDLTIKTRSVFEGERSTPVTEVLYLKGARERHESVVDGPTAGRSSDPSITQCDHRRTIQLNLNARTYAVTTFDSWISQARPVQAQRSAQGPDVLTTYDAIDTGERRQFGHYTARRITTTTTVEPSPGAYTLPSTTETDGWYIDLPGLGCGNGTGGTQNMVVVGAPPGRPEDHRVFKMKGTARRGYPIQETTRFSGVGPARIYRREFVSLSAEPLDPLLFDIPAGYQPALPLLSGGFDMDKPDTFANRLAEYRLALAQFVRRLLDW